MKTHWCPLQRVDISLNCMGMKAEWMCVSAKVIVKHQKVLKSNFNSICISGQTFCDWLKTLPEVQPWVFSDYQSMFPHTTEQSFLKKQISFIDLCPQFCRSLRNAMGYFLYLWCSLLYNRNVHGKRSTGWFQRPTNRNERIEYSRFKHICVYRIY